MTLRTNAPHAKGRWTALLVTLALALGLTATAVLAAPPGVTLDQCRNGAANAPSDCTNPGATNATGWVHGNVGSSQGHLLEGYSIPYRAVLTNLPLNTDIDITLGYDITHSGAHAIDYLTQYDRLLSHTFFGHDAEAVLPTSGVSGLSVDTDTLAIDKPSNLSAAASTGFDNLAADKKVMTIFGGTLNDGSFSYLTEGDINASQSEARVTFTFRATSSTVVLAWGGHIARGDQWDGDSASAISGSPYHMRVKGWTLGSVGNQDRSLSAGAVQTEQSTITTSPSGSATFTATLNDSATVSGDSPAGNVTFKLYGVGDTTCAGTPIFEKVVALDSSGMASTTSTGTASGTANDGGLAKVTVAGTYMWSVSYAGDGNNEGSSSVCAESTTVTAPSFSHVADPVVVVTP
jgi:hypothetical protein